MGTIVKLNSGATISSDDLNNVWYRSDIDYVLGKIHSNGKFIPAPSREFTSEMLESIAIAVKTINNKNNKND